MLIRDQIEADGPALHALVADAFRPIPYSAGQEPYVLEALWRAGDSALMLVATERGTILGQVAASKITLDGQSGWHGLGPIAVTPERQRAGIGTVLLRAALSRLRCAGSAGCVLVGDPAFYRRFGFANFAGLRVAGVPGEFVLALPFGTASPRGEAVFHAAFAELAPAS